jgi:hypothetical protein
LRKKEVKNRGGGGRKPGQRKEGDLQKVSIGGRGGVN